MFFVGEDIQQLSACHHAFASMVPGRPYIYIAAYRCVKNALINRIIGEFLSTILYRLCVSMTLGPPSCCARWAGGWEDEARQAGGRQHGLGEGTHYSPPPHPVFLWGRSRGGEWAGGGGHRAQSLARSLFFLRARFFLPYPVFYVVSVCSRHRLSPIYFLDSVPLFSLERLIPYFLKWRVSIVSAHPTRSFCFTVCVLFHA